MITETDSLARPRGAACSASRQLSTPTDGVRDCLVAARTARSRKLLTNGCFTVLTDCFVIKMCLFKWSFLNSFCCKFKCMGNLPNAIPKIVRCLRTCPYRSIEVLKYTYQQHQCGEQQALCSNMNGLLWHAVVTAVCVVRHDCAAIAGPPSLT